MNARVNYPIKRALNRIVETFDWDMSDEVLKYSISWVTIFTAKHAAEHLINSWNYHRVPGSEGCVPIDNMLRTKRTGNVIEPLIPTTVDAVKMYEALKGNLTRDSHFGFDPLLQNERRYDLRKTIFLNNQPPADVIFSEVVHGGVNLLKEAIEYFYEISYRLS